MTIREHIVAEIRRTARENGGRPLGWRRFFAETGIKLTDWYGKFWARWSEAVCEAGFAPNRLNAAAAENDVLQKLADFARELGRFPAISDLCLKKSRDSAFP